MTRIRSLLKYPGGKYALLDAIDKALPTRSIDVYAEPFLGGASVALNIGRRYSRMLLNDGNNDLINFWYQIANNPKQVLKEVEIYAGFHEIFNREFIYSACRRAFNLKSQEDHTLLAAQFYYLNKQGFNGLIRYNSKGEFNVPLGRYKNPPHLNGEHLDEVSNILSQNVILSSLEWETFIDCAVSKAIRSNKSVFLYIDPPYIPLTKTSNFTCYWKPFGIQEHEKLREKLDTLTELGAMWMLSNSKSEDTKRIFKGYKFSEVSAPRSISCKGNKRGAIVEYLITNY